MEALFQAEVLIEESKDYLDIQGINKSTNTIVDRINPVVLCVSFSLDLHPPRYFKS